MKFEVHCGDCGKAWMIDESSSGGEMVCECLSRIELPTAPPRTAKMVARVSSTAVRREPPAATPAIQVIPDEVVCPRCKLHFSPHNRPVEKADERETILVIEDQLYFRQIAEDALGPNYEVKVASNSAEARSRIAEGGIDLIVLDLTLEGGDQGRVLLNELNPKPCPILIFTAQDESDMYGNEWDELADLGADDLLIKGMNVADALVRKAAALLGHPAEEEPIG